MTDTSTFQSRIAKLKCSAEEFYYFITDIRNFSRFIPADTFNNIDIRQDACSFNAGMLGEVNVSITEKIMFSKVVFKGDAVQIKNSSIIVSIGESSDGSADVIVTLIAEMNPFLKMIAADPVNKFLEKLVDEMEKFGDWTNTKAENQSP
jgi:hypothetical protein